MGFFDDDDFNDFFDIMDDLEMLDEYDRKQQCKRKCKCIKKWIRYNKKASDDINIRCFFIIILRAFSVNLQLY